MVAASPMPRQCVGALVARIARVTLYPSHGDIVPAYHIRQPAPQIVILSCSKVAPNILSVPRQLGWAGDRPELPA